MLLHCGVGAPRYGRTPAATPASWRSLYPRETPPRGFMIPGGAPFRVGTLLGSLPIHPSSVSGCYRISASFFLILHCQRLEFVTESVTKPGHSPENSHRCEKRC